jgi:hypothetical protein
MAVCSVPVARAVMVSWWDELTFLHWRYPPEAVQPLLPEGLEVETCDGTAWVGLVPFFLRIALPELRPVPWLSRFAETNVRPTSAAPTASRASGSSPSTPPGSAPSSLPGPPTGSPTSGHRCGSSVEAEPSATNPGDGGQGRAGRRRP